MSSITIRVRYSGGTLRIEAKPTWTLLELKDKIRQILGLPQDQLLILSPSPPNKAGGDVEAFFDESLTLREQGLKHGDMIFLDSSGLKLVPTAPTTSAESKSIDPNGNLVLTKSAVDKAAFRPGLQSLRSQKLHWTLTEMTEYDNMYTFFIKGKEPLFCASASLDLPSAQAFQQYCQQVGFRRPRASFLYGKFEDVEETKPVEDDSSKNKQYGRTKGSMRIGDLPKEDDSIAKKFVTVECMYDPKQEVKDGNFFIDFSDEGIVTANQIASALGLTWVGIIFSHPPDRPFNFSAHEILETGVACLEATDGAVDSPFVVIKVSPNEEGIQMDAFQLTKTCLEMVKEEALENMPNEPAFFGVNERYQVIVEGKAALVVDTDFFIKRVPIKSHSSTIVNTSFPRLNRPGGSAPSESSLRNAIGRFFSNPKQLRKALKDFNLLLFLTGPLGAETVVEIINNLKEMPEDEPLPEGFQLMLQEVSK